MFMVEVIRYYRKRSSFGFILKQKRKEVNIIVAITQLFTYHFLFLGLN